MNNMKKGELQNLVNFPNTKAGKILRQGTPKEGVTLENLLVSYLDFIANELIEQKRKGSSPPVSG